MPISVPENLLIVEKLNAGYGKLDVLNDVSLNVRQGEIVTLLGPNGAGKTTLLSALSGLLPVQSGSVIFSGQVLNNKTPRECARTGLIHVIEGHRIFTQISVYDNLLLAGYDLSRHERRQRVEEALYYFPEISEKRMDRGGALSGGQQQMLAVAQGLVRRPRLLMLDEPSAGLSPILIDRVLSVLLILKSKGVSILLVEQLIEKSLSVSDRLYALSQGRIVLDAPSGETDIMTKIEKAYLG